MGLIGGRVGSIRNGPGDGPEGLMPDGWPDSEAKNIWAFAHTLIDKPDFLYWQREIHLSLPTP